MQQISLVIPVLNEAANLEKLLPCLKERSTAGAVKEVLVVDGGSRDASVAIARKHGARLLQSDTGRALQMNAGAEAARGDILYFLHADSFPPPGYDRLILDAQSPGPTAGCFRLRFDRPNLVLAAFAWCTRWNWPICRGGDQSLFIPAAWFRTLGGYNTSYRIYEDNEFTGRIYRRYPFRVLPHTVHTSARKYAQIGVLRLQYHFGVIHLLRYTGAGPQRLYRYYQAHIQKSRQGRPGEAAG